MASYTLMLGRAHTNIHSLIVDNSLKGNSSPEKVIPEEALKLLKENQQLEPSCCEQWRAKVISHIIGGALPLAIAAIFAAAMYALYITGAAYAIYTQAIAVIGPFAQNAFNTITQNATNMAISGGAVLATGVVLTRAPVYEAIGSCLGSCCGTVTGAGIVGFFYNIHAIGYNWWYNTYQFDHREAIIKQNHGSALKILKETYDEMADNMQQALKQDENNPHNLKVLKEQAETLQKKFIPIEQIFIKYGIEKNEYEEITLKLDEAVNGVIDYDPQNNEATF